MSTGTSLSDIKLTQYSHGAGCGCKIAPRVLQTILESDFELPSDSRLLVGNESSDDAAAYDLGDGTAVISTTDFFMPIVDDPFDFGRIASANAISDIFAMGGRPLVAISILGWPVDKIPAEIAREVLEGSRSICREAGITLAGGHSIDNPEPIFGLAVTGQVQTKYLKQNSKARPGDYLFLTKPLGVGILSTAQKKGILKERHQATARDLMVQLNKIGKELGKIEAISTMTDVTGFGLLGHLLELCEGSGVAAEVDFNKVPILDGLGYYLDAQSTPGGTQRNWASYGEKIGSLSSKQQNILCDPQTSGGLLVAVRKEGLEIYRKLTEQFDLPDYTRIPLGRIIKKTGTDKVLITIS
ncbi:MAG: selenide, water dikinase SelD [Balneolaceae bacterium]|jgi:selenide,water dikinase